MPDPPPVTTAASGFQRCVRAHSVLTHIRTDLSLDVEEFRYGEVLRVTHISIEKTLGDDLGSSNEWQLPDIAARF